MKKLILMAAAALLLTTQCRKNADTLVTPSDGVKMTVTVNPGRVTVDDVTGTIAWENNEMLYVSNGNEWIGWLTNGSGGGNIFSGNVASFDKDKTYHFFYFGKLDVGTPTGSDEVEISLAYQGGTKSGALRHQLGHGAKKFEEAESTDNTMRLESMVALAKMDFTKSGTDYTGMVKLGGTGIANKVGVSPVFEEDQDVPTTEATDGGIYLGVTGTKTKYVMLAPASGSTAVNVNGGSEASIKFDGGIEAGKYYGMKAALRVEFTEDYAEANLEYVDLGLPSGRLWATRNLGATSPTEYGDFYAWGEVMPYYEDGHSRDNPCEVWRKMTTGAKNTDLTKGYAWESYSQGGASDFTEWTTTPYDETTKLLTSAYDAATGVWGEGWRMPTEADFTELLSESNTTWRWVNAEGQNTPAGYTVDSKTESNQSLFLPAVGRRYGVNFYNAGTVGYYWSSSLANNARDVRSLHLDSDGFSMDIKYRCYGFSVRPVRAR